MNQYRIGHQAYQNENRMEFATSKTAAIRELRSRGCKRDEARAAVKCADRGLRGFSTIEIVRSNFHH